MRIVFFAVFAALVGGVVGAVVPKGGLLRSLQLGGLFAGVTAVALLLGLATGVPLGLLLRKTAPRPVRAIVAGALLGCPLGSLLWRAWFEVGYFNLGIAVVGIPMAFAFFIIERQAGKPADGS